MKISKISLILFLSVSIIQTAFAFSRPPVTSDTCPAEDNIKQIGNTYTAPGGWVGVVQKKADEIQAFEMVIYKPENINVPFKKGEILRCVYKLNNGSFLDLRLPKTDNSAYISSSKSWQSIYGGNQFICNKKRLACDFHLNK